MASATRGSSMNRTGDRPSPTPVTKAKGKAGGRALKRAGKPSIPPVAVRIIGEPPPQLTRPLGLVRGKAYAATWPHSEVIINQQEDERGKVVKLIPPKVIIGPCLHIIGEDGSVHPQPAQAEVAMLPFHVTVGDSPPADRTWSYNGVKAYAAGSHPSPLAAFVRVQRVLNHFVDFDGSLANQKLMTEMLSCYVLSTYFSDALSVLGYLWITGPTGSGKSQLLTTLAEVCYLGTMITPGGTFAALRDLGAQGAFLAFDDAEHLFDKRADPNKLSLLLSGNRRGTTVAFKEPVGLRNWRTRHVPVFCPRAFSATQVPHPTLARRSIMVPLRRSSDTAKANGDPTDHESWPHNRRGIVDSLWALGLKHLAQLREFDERVPDFSGLSGATLTPWRGILAVALFLGDSGLRSLPQRMVGLAHAYRREPLHIATGDLAASAVRVFRETAVEVEPGLLMAETGLITREIQALAQRGDLDMEPAEVTAKKVGRVLGQLRLRQRPRPGGRGGRGWQIGTDELSALEESYGLRIRS